MKTHFNLKKTLILSASIWAGITYGQVGINTQTPNTIFDINAKRNPSGELTSNDQTFGLQAPRVSRQELTNNTASYGSNQNGALIYVTDISGGTSSGQREFMTSIGYYYFDAVANRWLKVMNNSNVAAYTATNGTTMNGNQIKLGGALTEATTISNVSATNKLAITGTGVDAINFDNNTISIDATNNRVGIGVALPTNKLHINATNPIRAEGIAAGDPNTDRLMVIDGNGVLKSINTLSALSLPTPAIFRLNSSRNNFLDGVGAGSKQTVPMSLVKNTIDGLTYDSSTSTITIPPGNYQMVFVYEAIHNSTGCTLSSYIVDFPTGSTSVQRIHSTASHLQGGLSNHGGSITYTTQIPTTRDWKIELGRGQSGNCSGTGMSLTGLSTHLLVFRIGDL